MYVYIYYFSLLLIHCLCMYFHVYKINLQFCTLATLRVPFQEIVLLQNTFYAAVGLGALLTIFAYFLYIWTSTNMFFFPKQITWLVPRPQFLFFTLHFICLRMELTRHLSKLYHPAGKSSQSQLDYLQYNCRFKPFFDCSSTASSTKVSGSLRYAKNSHGNSPSRN